MDILVSLEMSDLMVLLQKECMILSKEIYKADFIKQ